MLTLLGFCFLLLLALAVLGATGRAARIGFLGCGVAMVGFVVLGLAAQIGPVSLPVGPPWAPMVIALDPLSAWFLLILGVVGLPACLFAAASPPPPRAEGAAFPLFLAGMAMTLIAADAFTLLLGFELMSLASWVLIAARHATGAGRRAARL